METFETLPAELRDVLATQGIVTPTGIQSRALPPAIEGRDLLAQSHTGSGKTLAFALPLGVRMKGHGALRTLILTPTRELAAQVAGVLDGTLTSLKLRTLAITGGASYYKQKKSLSYGMDIVVGTPGRIGDLLAQGILDLSTIEHFVLDEVDQMLDIGFADELEKIRTALPAAVQTLFFSATLSPEIRSLARKTLKNPVEILAPRSESQGPSTIRHRYLEVRANSEQKALINALLFHNPVQALIFCKTKQECADLSEALAQRGFNAAALHGDLTQIDRNQTMERFRDKRLQYLVATNVAARGIDVQDLPLVVNFGVPFDTESYTHRVGRTGRNGAEGQAWTIVTPPAVRSYEFLMRKMKLKPEPIPVPSCSEVVHRSAEMLVEEMKAARPGQVNRTVEKAVGRTLEKLSEEDKNQLLREMMLRRLEKLDSYYHDDIVVNKPLVRLDADFADRAKRRPGFNAKFGRSEQRDGARPFRGDRSGGGHGGYAGRGERGDRGDRGGDFKRGHGKPGAPFNRTQREGDRPYCKPADQTKRFVSGNRSFG
jgi:ATP-dependent RNA helicase DeaD